MNLTDAPAKLTAAFAVAGDKNNIPVVYSGVPGSASWDEGFPPETGLPVSGGGIPPSRKDFNGAFNALSALDIWYSAGAGFVFDSVFAAAVGGYPKGARVLRADGKGYWFNITDANTNDPDAGGAGWVPTRAVSSVYASAQQTLAVGNAKVIFDTTEFDDGLWDAANHRFHALYAGRYRLSGSVMLSAPGGQSLATQIWKNGAVAKQCFAAPQLSDENMSLPFEALLNLAAGDYLEAFLVVTQTNVLAGQVGSNQAFVFAQCEYLGG